MSDIKNVGRKVKKMQHIFYQKSFLLQYFYLTLFLSNKLFPEKIKIKYCIAAQNLIVSLLETQVERNLSTFGGPVVKGSLVQLRRPTNKRGKTAPAPPKRTR